MDKYNKKKRKKEKKREKKKETRKDMKNWSMIFLFVVLCVCIFWYVQQNMKMEAFTSLSSSASPSFSSSASSTASSVGPLLNDFPLKANKNELSDNGYADIWFHYPVFKAGSYKQLTNNLKYPDNPDNGTCIRADFCGALYHDAEHRPSNVIHPLPPAEEGQGARVGYFRTSPNELFFSIPTNDNVLY